MRITYLKLQNYRCFDQIELSLHPELTVIVGTNGAGKSSLLDAITVAFGPYLAKFDDGKGDGFKQSDARRVSSEHNAFEMLPQYPLTLEAIADWRYPESLRNPPMSLPSTSLEAYNSPESLLKSGMPLKEMQGALRQQSWGSQAWYWRRELLGPKNITTNKDARYLYDYAAGLQKTLRTGSDLILPILGHYGTGRLWALQKLGQSAEHLLSGSRTLGYRECLNKSSSFKGFAYWFQQLHLAIVGNRDLIEQGLPPQHDERLKAIRQAVVNAINICLEGSNWVNLHYSAASQEIQVHHRNNRLGVMPVSQLSDGIRSVLALAADIAFRCCKLNGHLGIEATQQTPGIVLIDELDLHLHAAWQQTIVQAFRKAFPKIQFILTTHSPHLLSTVPSECIRVLDDGQIRQAPAGTQGAEAQRILNDVFGVASRPQQDSNTQLLKKYLDLIYADQWSSEEAKTWRQQLDQIYQGNEPALFEADLYIANRKWELESDEEDSEVS